MSLAARRAERLRAGILLSVREKATRFPGKVLKPLGSGTNVTQFLLRRLQRSARAETVILATSDDPRDQVLCELAGREQVSAFCGSADDKLLRYRDAAMAHNLDFVIIVDGDDPFVSVTHIDRIIEYANGEDADLVMFANLPLGATGFGLRTRALEAICSNRPEMDTEVWGNLFRENPEYRCVDLAEDDETLARPEVRMTLDYPEDYIFFSQIVAGLEKEGKGSGFEEIMDYLARHPEVIEVNRAVQEAYEAHLKKSTHTEGTTA